MKTIDLRPRCLRCQKIPRGKLPLKNYSFYKPFCSFHCKGWNEIEQSAKRVAELRKLP